MSLGTSVHVSNNKSMTGKQYSNWKLGSHSLCLETEQSKS